MPAYQPKTGARCSCKRGISRDNCPTCEGTGWVIDFRKIHAERAIFILLSQNVPGNQSAAKEPQP